MTKTNRAMICTSCNNPKAELKKKQSKALPGVTMFLCKECLDNKREPRGFIVLAGRQDGIDSISFWVKGHRYVGEPITARELS